MNTQLKHWMSYHDHHVTKFMVKLPLKKVVHAPKRIVQILKKKRHYVLHDYST